MAGLLQAQPPVALSPDRLENLRRVWGSETAGPIATELDFLSPYSLPLPVERSSKTTEALAARGFATVLRLPLRSDGARALVEERLSKEKLDAEDLLFLSELRALEIDLPSRRALFRRQPRGEGEVELWEAQDQHRTRYRIWHRRVGGEADRLGATQLSEVASDLPGRWPELREAMISVGVRVGDGEPQRGRFFAFLPTEMETGTGAHVNAPFYAEISRTTVDLTTDLNKLLLSWVGSLIGEIIREHLVLSDAVHAAMLVDLIAPIDGDDITPATVLREWPEGAPPFS